MPSFLIVRTLFLGLLLLLGVLDYFLLEIPFLYYLLLCLVFVSVIIWGSSNIGSGFFLPALTNLHTGRKAIALTFDDGPSPDHTPKVLDILDRYNAKATFFCIGKNMEKSPDLTREIVARGHTLGNHSYSHHFFFSFFGKNSVITEIKKTSRLIAQISGKKCGLFRPPYGVTNPSIAKAVKSCQMKVVGWDIRSYDTTLRNESAVANRVIKRIRPGSVILLHDNRPGTERILAKILTYTSENNYNYAQIKDL